MQDLIAKAATLLEALPYIQKFIDLGPDCDRGKSIKEHARTVVSKLSATE